MNGFYYDVYDGEELVAERQLRSDIAAKFNLVNPKMNKYTQGGCLINGKYRVVRAGRIEAEPKEKPLMQVFTATTLKEWRMLNKRYGKRCK